MKSILLTGLDARTTEEEIRAWLGRFGPVQQISLVRKGNAQAPLAVVKMDIDNAQAHYITSRISNYWHSGSLVSALLLIH